MPVPLPSATMGTQCSHSATQRDIRGDFQKILTQPLTYVSNC